MTATRKELLTMTREELLDEAIKVGCIGSEDEAAKPYLTKADLIDRILGDATGSGSEPRRMTADGLAGMFCELARDAVSQEIASRGDLIPNITVQVGERPEVKVDGVAHEKLPDVLHMVEAGIPVYMVGPSGSGKTHLAGQLAQALGREFTFNSFSMGVTESSLLGRVLPPSWEYKPSPFVRNFEGGGVHLFDEIDSADANLLVYVNAAIANGKLGIPFADRVVQRHADTVIIAAANTYGKGADRQYVGRNALDAATLDRFTMGTIEIDYSKRIERAIAESILKSAQADDLLSWAWQIRGRIEKLRLRRLMSTRTIENASRRLAVGAALADVSATYFTGWSEDEIKQVS